MADGRRFWWRSRVKFLAGTVEGLEALAADLKGYQDHLDTVQDAIGLLKGDLDFAYRRLEEMADEEPQEAPAEVDEKDIPI